MRMIVEHEYKKDSHLTYLLSCMICKKPDASSVGDIVSELMIASKLSDFKLYE